MKWEGVDPMLTNAPLRRAAKLCVVFAAAALAPACTKVEMPDVNRHAQVADPDIDLSAYDVTFDEDFDRLDVSGRSCETRWIAHTPWNGDFGYAAFADPSRGFPFVAQDSVLRIEARREPDGRWVSGLLAAWNSCDEGFAQRYGYFEARVMLPEGDGMWPAFWLIGADSSDYTAEVDVFEHHGDTPGAFTSTIHVHPHTDGVRRVNAWNGHDLAPEQLYDRFNTFGVEIGERDTVFYFNRKEIWRTETIPELRQPFYPLVNLAIAEEDISDDSPDGGFMFVDYVRVYKRR